MPTPDPLAPFVEQPRRSAVVVDFDGSLARVVDDPRAARPLPQSVDALRRLVRVIGLVAVVSGRPVSFLRRTLPVDGLVLAGLYGMERLVDGEVIVAEAVEPYLGAAEEAAADAERVLPGLYVERKGEIACVIHWRTAPDREDEALTLGREVAVHHGLVAHPGRMSLEIRPPVDLDKGTTLESLTTGMSAVLFAGDDTGDLAAFDALHRLERDGGIRYGLRIGVVSPEAPPELLERADERVDGPEELAVLLRGLADAVEDAIAR